MNLRDYVRIILFLPVIILVFSCNKDEEEFKNFPPVPDLEEEVLTLINDYRDSLDNAVDTLNLEVILMEDFIREEARKHSNNMASGKVSFGHEGFSDRVNKINENLGIGNIGENVAMGHPDAETVVRAWIKSDSHRANIIGNYNQTGIGIVQDDEGIYFYTQIFYKAVE